jgi:hypothetical protein
MNHSWGCLEEGAGAMKGAGGGLNEFVHEAANDAFTLLQVAAANGHLESVQALLANSEVEVDLASRLCNKTSVFVASLCGHEGKTTARVI